MDPGNVENEMPGVRLNTALYGHKNSGVFWQKYCDKQCREAGFEKISDNWSSMYYHPVTKMLLIVYVDDMKLAGPTEHMAATWEKLGKNIKLETPKGDTDGDTHTFLGCIHRRVDKDIHIKDGVKTVRCMEYDMTAQWAGLSKSMNRPCST